MADPHVRFDSMTSDNAYCGEFLLNASDNVSERLQKMFLLFLNRLLLRQTLNVNKLLLL